MTYHHKGAHTTALELRDTGIGQCKRHVLMGSVAWLIEADIESIHIMCIMFLVSSS